MKINKISWKNIYSYGNKEEVLDFSGEGLWQLFGKSGSGKSTIIQMPQLLLYGKTMAKMNKSDVANRTNKHGEIRGELTANADTYVIVRKFDPDDLEVIKNGETMDFPTKVETQKYIDTVVLENLPLDIFKNVLTLSLNNFTSFITISPADKRKIIDNIFSMDIINDCVELMKDEKKVLASNINTLNGNISTLDGEIYRTNIKLIDKRNALTLDKETAAKEQSIIDAINKVDEKTPELISKNAEINSRYKLLVGEKSALETEANKSRLELKECEKKISLFKQSKCPTCGSPFDTTEFVELLGQYESAKDEIVKAINDKVEETNKKIEEINELAAESSEATEEFNKLTKKRNSLNDWLLKINGYKSAKASIDETEVELKRLNESKDEKSIALGESNELLTNFKLLESVYSDDGVKKFHREKYIPTLNAELKTALEFLEFPYQLMFDKDFNAQLKYRGEKINIESLSAGERKKVDLCVLCSLIRIIKQKYPSINVIGLDETISSLDYDSSVMLLKYLKNMSSELGINILIVSHTTLDESLFDRRLFVDKHDGFSGIKEQ